MTDVIHMNTVTLHLLASLTLSAHVTEIKTRPSFNNDNQAVNKFPIETALLNIYSKECIDILSVIIEDEPTVIETKVIPKGTMVFNNQWVQSASISNCYSIHTQEELLGNKASYSYSTADGIKTISYGSE